MHQFKNQAIEAEEISKFSEKIKNFANEVRKSDEFREIYENYLTIRGFTYRLEDSKQRLFYTFQEGVYAIDLAKLTRDAEGVKVNSLVYIVVIDACLDEFLGKSIDEDEKEEAINFYQEVEERKAKENQKYHMYQY